MYGRGSTRVHLFQGNFTSGVGTQGWNVNSAKDRQDLRRGICKLHRYVRLSARGKKSIGGNLKGKGRCKRGVSLQRGLTELKGRKVGRGRDRTRPRVRITRYLLDGERSNVIAVFTPLNRNIDC